MVKSLCFYEIYFYYSFRTNALKTSHFLSFLFQNYCPLNITHSTVNLHFLIFPQHGTNYLTYSQHSNHLQTTIWRSWQDVSLSVRHLKSLGSSQVLKELGQVFELCPRIVFKMIWEGLVHSIILFQIRTTECPPSPTSV